MDLQIVRRYNQTRWVLVPLFPPGTPVGDKLLDRDYFRSVALRSLDPPEVDIWVPDHDGYSAFLAALDGWLSPESRKLLLDDRILLIAPKGRSLHTVGPLPEDDPASVKRALLGLLEVVRSEDPVAALIAYTSPPGPPESILTKDNTKLVFEAIRTVTGVLDLLRPSGGP